MDKADVWNALDRLLEKNIQDIQQNLNSIEHAKTQETKSSVGDKFETGRAMLQIEEDKLLGQLKRNKNYLLQLQVYMQNDKKHETVQEGSLVVCDKGTFFIGLGLGKLKLDNCELFAVSIAAPFSKQIIGLREGSTFSIKQKQFMISEIL
jgi:hypothetical protein